MHRGVGWWWRRRPHTPFTKHPGSTSGLCGRCETLHIGLATNAARLLRGGRATAADHERVFAGARVASEHGRLGIDVGAKGLAALFAAGGTAFDAGARRGARVAVAGGLLAAAARGERDEEQQESGEPAG